MFTNITLPDAPQTVHVDGTETAIVPDDHADTSYLLQDGWGDRWKAYCDGMFHHVGIYAEATVLVPKGDDYYNMQTVRSSGLWGIASDSTGDYLATVIDEQLDDLADTLQQMGVDISTDPDLAKRL